MEELEVEPQDGAGHGLISPTLDHSGNAWKVECKDNPRKVPRLTAQSFASSRVYHRDEISLLRSQLLRANAGLAENKCNRGRLRWRPESKTGKVCGVDHGSEGSESPPLDTRFDKAARRRHEKSANQIEPEDLFDSVNRMRLTIIRPLRDVLSDTF